jgi:uracil-DNA glycosylase
MAAIDNDWLEPLSAEFRKPYYAQLYKKVRDEYASFQVYPPAGDILNAFHLTPLSAV